jgi:hypothetical protein
MEGGDLATSVRPRIVVVLEGVLASISEIEEPSRFLRRPKVTGYNLHWHDAPLKRLVTMKTLYPNTGIDVVTFISQDVADDAADFFNRINLAVSDSVEYHPFLPWSSALRYQTNIGMIVDSDEDRLNSYGQLGRAVTRGMDW